MYMQLKVKKLVIAYVIILLMLIINVGFISSADTTSGTTTGGTASSDGEFTDISKLLGWKEGSIFGSGVEVSSNGILSFLNENSKLILNKGEDNQIILTGAQDVQIPKSLSQITFSGENGKITINGNKFEKIVPASKDNDAYIRLNRLTGDISQVKFKTSAIGEYNIRGASFTTDKDSIVDYNTAGDGRLKIENAKIKEIKKAISIYGENVNLADGYNLNKGFLKFDKEGQSYLDNPSEAASINGIDISPTDKRLDLFFNKKGQKGYYISFNKNSLTVNGPLSMTLNPGNTYTPSMKDRIGISTGPSSTLILENRDLSGLIPKINLYGNSDTYISNGEKSIHYSSEDNKWYIENLRNSDFITSTAIEISKENSNEKVFVDNLNRAAVVSSDSGEYEYIGKNGGYDKKISSRILYNYPTEETLEELTGKDIIFSEGFPSLQKQSQLQKLNEYWGTLTPETKDAVKGIKFSKEIVISKISQFRYKLAGYPGRDKVAGLADYSGEVEFSLEGGGMDFSTFRHEVAHIRHHEILSTFNKVWKAIDGKPITVYGDVNIREDVATTVEEIVTSPDDYALLMGNSLDRGKKLEALYKYKFISESEYKKVLEDYKKRWEF